MQPDKAKIAGLAYAILVVEEQANAVAGIIPLGLDLSVRDEGDVGIGVAKERDELLAHGAGETAVVSFLELHRIGKPTQRVANCANRKLNQHLAVGG